jgi:molecular chaperone HscB
MTDLDYFARLGLPRRFALNPAELECQYLARSRAVHPDYHAAGGTADLSVSLELSAGLNEAYNTLKDPFARAEYLLGLEGGPPAATHKEMPQAFLAEMLDLREQVEQARVTGRDGPTADRLAGEFSARYDALMDEVAARFAEYDRLPPGDPSQATLRPRIRTLLNAAKYVRGLIRDLHAE